MPLYIRRKIFLCYALPILCSLLLLAVLSYGLIRQSLGNLEGEELGVLSADYAHRLDDLMDDRIATLERVETLDYRHNFRELALSSHLAKFFRPFPVLSYLNAQGREEVKVVAGKKSDQLLDYGSEPWFQDALQHKNKVVVGTLKRSPELNEPCLTLGLARYGYFGDEFEGVLRAELPLADLTQELQGLVPGQGGYAILLDQNGTVLFHPQARFRFHPLPGFDTLPSLPGATKGSSAAVVELAGAKVLVARAEVPQLGWTVLAVLPYTEFIAPSVRLGWFTLAIALTVLTLGVLLAQRIAAPFTRNLGQVIDHTARIAGGVLDRPLELQSGDELESLAASLNQMSTSIARALASRDALQGILQSIIDPLFILDPQFCIREVNDAAGLLLGEEQAALLERPFVDCIAASAEESGALLERIRGEGSLRNEALWMRHSSGEQRPVLLSCSLPEAVSNPDIGLVAICKDITDLTLAEEARRRALNLVEALLAQSPVGIRVFDGVTGACLRSNQAAALIAGRPVEELLAQNFRHIDAWRDSGLGEVAEQVLADGGARQLVKEMPTGSGKQLTARYYFSRFLAENHPHLMVIGQDITEERRLAEEKRQVEEQMLHVQKLESLGVLAGGIAHDFNNLLMAIMGNADLAVQRLAAESPAVSHLQQILAASGRAADLAGQMLAYSGRGRFVVENLDLNRLIEEMMHMLEVSISKKAHLRFDFNRQLPTVEADATQLRQVIMNLVINASEAIGEKSGVIALRTGAIDCDDEYLRGTWLDEGLEPGLYVFFEVADTGCGMDQETLEKIFDPFFSTKFTGRGLGMAAVLGIVRGHQGAIKVYSEVGKGTTFKVLLPAACLPEDLFDSPADDSAWWGSGQVLLVDDEETVRAVGGTMLSDLGFEVLSAGSGREALELFREHQQTIRLVLMDLTMPNMGGEEAFRELRRLDPEVRVIITSGYSEQEVAHRFVGKGLTGFLQKPFRLSTLREALQVVGAGEE